jgi:hypothetical protein
MKRKVEPYAIYFPRRNHDDLVCQKCKMISHTIWEGRRVPCHTKLADLCTSCYDKQQQKIIDERNKDMREQEDLKDQIANLYRFSILKGMSSDEFTESLLNLINKQP